MPLGVIRPLHSPARLAAAAIVATIAFWAYTQTLLPGVDLGDTGGFQAAVLWPAVSARQAYPLYYSLAKPFVETLGGTHPARALNLFSAVWGAGAIGILTLLVAELAASTLAGVIAGLLLAVSYTFWTQAIIAEVYTLHLALVGACLLALVAYARSCQAGLAEGTSRAITARLAIFCAIYALAFGNHLSMIILFVPFATLVVLAHPDRRALFRPGIIVMAIGIAVAGALQYWPNFQQVWSGIDAPPRWTERLAAFWFDTTKADWRESMILGVGASKVGERLAMWWWDARQQFGVVGLALAVAGAVRIWRISRIWAIVLWLAYACTSAFAFTYNVGDSHVFFLPSHYFTALFAGIAITWLPIAVAADTSRGTAALPGRRATASVLLQSAAVLFVVAYIGWRAWDTWPAVDRHTDRRGEALVARIANGADEANAVIVSDMDWQSENALLYSSRWERRNLAWVRMADVLPRFPFFVRDNHALGRDVVLTTDAARDVVAAYADLFPLEPIDAPDAASLRAIVGTIPRGAPYVLTLLEPTAGVTFDASDYDAAVATLAAGRAAPRSGRAFEVLAGVAGERPALQRSEDRPFRQTVDIAGDRFTVRMEAWLPDDTFRRAGFGHVLLGRERLLIIERGASLVWLTASGQPQTGYAAGLYAARPRFRIPRATLQFAALPRAH
jgi:hypothetical protein